jgi:hypothetical protein
MLWIDSRRIWNHTIRTGTFIVCWRTIYWYHLARSACRFWHCSIFISLIITMMVRLKQSFHSLIHQAVSCQRQSNPDVSAVPLLPFRIKDSRVGGWRSGNFNSFIKWHLFTVSAPTSVKRYSRACRFNPLCNSHVKATFDRSVQCSIE